MNPNAALFSVSQFREMYTDFLRDQRDPELEGIPVDISSEDLKMETKYEKVDKRIRKRLAKLNEIGKEEEEEEEKEKIEEDKEEKAKEEAYNKMEKNAEEKLLSVKEGAETMKNRKRKEVNYITNQAPQPPDTFEKLPPNEILLSIAIYHPQRSQKTQEFRVCASQPLTALADCFYCLSDHILEGPNVKSKFFFIENVFYNDMRDPSAIDYSQYIINWVNEENRYTQPGLGIFTSKSMEECTFYDLSIRIGQPYLYVHQGNCEHVIMFTEMRLVHRDDNQNKNCYPIHTFQCKIRRKKCRICDIYAAKFVTYNDPIADENPCFFCENCYRPLHYSYEGKLLFQDFEVYPYYHE